MYHLLTTKTTTNKQLKLGLKYIIFSFLLLFSSRRRFVSTRPQSPLFPLHVATGPSFQCVCGAPRTVRAAVFRRSTVTLNKRETKKKEHPGKPPSEPAAGAKGPAQYGPGASPKTKPVTPDFFPCFRAPAVMGPVAAADRSPAACSLATSRRPILRPADPRACARPSPAVTIPPRGRVALGVRENVCPANLLPRGPRVGGAPLLLLPSSRCFPGLLLVPAVPVAMATLGAWRCPRDCAMVGRLAGRPNSLTSREQMVALPSCGSRGRWVGGGQNSGQPHRHFVRLRPP